MPHSQKRAALFQEMLTAISLKLADDAHLFTFTHQDSYEAFLQVLRAQGFTIRRTLTWNKVQHGTGDVTRAEVLTQTEWIIHAVRGNPKFCEDVDRSEIITVQTTQDTEHPAEKPLELLQHLIRSSS